MAQIITTDDLVADIRVMSGLRNNQLFSNDQILALVSDAGDELYDIVEGSFEHYFDKPFDFTIASGASTATLPDNFKRDNSLTRNWGTSFPETVDVLGSWLERNQSAGPWTPVKRRYFLSGNTLEIFPASVAPGNYRLFYTPQFEFEAPGTPTASVQLATVAALDEYSTSGPAGPGRVLTATNNGALEIDGVTPSPGVQVLAKDEPNAAANGVYTVTTVGSSGAPFVLTRPAYTYAAGLLLSVVAGPANHGKYFELVSSPVDVDVLPMIWEAAQTTLPRAMVPWAEYLKVHSSIAIRTSRQQDTGDLERKLQALNVRVAKSSKNRTEAPRQAPITRHGRRGYGAGGW